MNERRYEVGQGQCGDVLGSNMRLEDALLFIDAIFNKYPSERHLLITIKEMEKPTQNSQVV